MTANNSKTIIVIAAASILLAGCQTNPKITGQVFQGYPCQDNCENFIKGYEQAKNDRYTDDAQCDLVESDLRLGCLSYMREYRLLKEEPNGGYVFINNKTI